MKYATLFLCSLLSLFVAAQTGADCANAIPLTLDGVCRSYATSSSVGNSVVCTTYTGSSPITYFSFTTNSTADQVLIDLTAPTAQPCEVALYTNSCSVMYSSGGMCFDDGKGLWAFSSNFSIQPNTTYKLRIKTTTTGNITLCSKYYTPPNNTCAGATSIGTTAISDNNACNGPGTEITSVALGCGFTLENTAFYKFYVASDGVCVVNINNISCDNGDGNNSNGFQTLFFDGNCSSLNSLGCQSNTNSSSSSFLQFTTPSLTAGTKVTVAIDGIQGSNCSYNISGLNITSVLDADLENFTGWKTTTSNLLHWTILNEGYSDYLIERSENGKDFHPIGKLKSTTTGKFKTNYSFEDRQPERRSYYRIRRIGFDGKISLTSVLLLQRDEMPDIAVNVVNPVFANTLDMRIYSPQEQQFVYVITNLAGQFIFRGVVDCGTGNNYLKKDLSSLAAGKYFITLMDGDKKLTRTIIKMN